MKRFKSYIDEAPLPPEFSKTPKKKVGGFKRKIDYSAIIKKFREAGYKSLSEGSSRIAFDCEVPIDCFLKDDKTKYQLGSGKVETVVKMALSSVGVFQNTVELDIWRQAKDTPYERFLCPIFDWSGNPRYKNNVQYTLDFQDYRVDVTSEYKGALWVQMPLVETCETKGEKHLLNAIKEYFGPNTSAGFCDLWGVSLNRLPDRLEAKRKKGANEEQLKNYEEYTKMTNEFELGDAHQFNWGVYKGIPVLIDYGYHIPTTGKVYGGEGLFKVFVDKSGAIKVLFIDNSDDKIDSSDGSWDKMYND